MVSSATLSEEAKKNVQAWLDGPYDMETKKTIERMKAEASSELENAFYSYLSFGTGGMRGLMGVGPNRMNIYTIRQTTKGLADYIRKSFPGKQLKVFIGFDSRKNSQLFAREAARVLAGASIEAFVCKELRPTPLVSFACRHLQCQAAIMITASHNPPEYNGYKVYWSDGGQVLPPYDSCIIQEVEKARRGGAIRVSPEDDPFIHIVGKEIDEEYLKAIRPLELWPSTDKSSLSVLYSCLHGTGGTLVPPAFRQIGLHSLFLLTPQMTPDGTFPTAKIPNPEEEGALRLGIDEMISKNHDIFLATDPDADRLGVVVNHKGTPVILTGNQIASIAAEWVLRRLKEQNKLPERPAVVKSIVTTPLIQKIATAWGATCFDVLTGFKYIAKCMNEWEKDPSSYQFILGCEESYGTLYGTHAHDKDAVEGSCMMAEIAWHLKKEGKTLVDALEDIWKTYGYFGEALYTHSFGETKAGRDRMSEVMKTLRQKPPSHFANMKCVASEDLSTNTFQGDALYQIGKNLPQSDVLIYTLEDGSRIIIRPSGTEPKVKVYLMLSPLSGSNLTLQQKKDLMNKRIDQLKLFIGGLF